MFSKFYGKFQSQGKPGYENEPIAGQSNDIRTSAHDFGLVRPDDLALGATRIQPGASSNTNINYSEGKLGSPRTLSAACNSNSFRRPDLSLPRTPTNPRRVGWL